MPVEKRREAMSQRPIPVELNDAELDAVAGGGHRQALRQARDAARGDWDAFAARIRGAVEEAVDGLDQENLSEASVSVSISIGPRHLSYTR
jgi:hypothetical protein